MATGSTEVRKLLDLIKEQDCEVEESHGTVRVKTPNGERVQFSFVSSTARSLSNLKAALRRAGVVTNAAEWKRTKKAEARREAQANHEHSFLRAEAGFIVGGAAKGINVVTTEGCSCGAMRDRTEKEIQVDHLLALTRLSHGRVLTPAELHTHDRLVAEAVDPKPDWRETWSEEVLPAIVCEVQEDEIAKYGRPRSGDTSWFDEPSTEVPIVPLEPEGDYAPDTERIAPALEEEIFLSEEDEIEAMIARAKSEAA